MGRFQIRAVVMVCIITVLSACSTVSPAPQSAEALERFAAGTTVFSEDFSSFAGAGFAPGGGEGRLDSNVWSATGIAGQNVGFGETATSGRFAAGMSAGGVSFGAIYAFNVTEGVRILGVQPTGDVFTPGSFVLRVENPTDTEIDTLTVSYDIWYYNDQGRANALNFAYSRNNDAFTEVPALNFTTPGPADSPVSWQRVLRETTLTGLDISADGAIYFRWRGADAGGSGSRDEYGITNVRVVLGEGDTTPPDDEPPVEEPKVCETDYTPIADIWTGDATGNVTVQGVVTADFRSGLNGFFIQDVEGEGFPKVSDGIFVFTQRENPFSSYTLAEGDLLRVSASTGAFQGARQLTFVRDIVTCDRGVEVMPVELVLPLTPDDRWAFVGMLTTLPQDLAVTENFLLGRFGMLSVAEGGRLYHPNNGNVAGTPEAIRASNLERRLIIDDGSTVQNPDEVPFLDVADPVTGESDTIRIGDTMQEGVTGVMSYGRPSTFNASGPEDFRLHVLDTTAVGFDATNPRPASPKPVGGTITVSSYNVLNYFVTFDDGRNLSRGARNESEFRRQRTKLIAAIQEIDADILGLIEMENEDTVQGALGIPKEQRRSAVEDLVNGLNEAYGREVYAAMPDPADVGTDAIKQAIIYKPGSVTFLAAASDSDPVHNRPPVAGTFRQNAAPFGAVSLIVVHHKSKRCSSGFDDRPGDTERQFEGCFDQLRTEQSQALRAFAAELKAQRSDMDVMIMGDLNAYALENPIKTLTTTGFDNLTLMMDDSERYSFVFDGEAGTLDYAFASETLQAQVTGVDIWHINPDEPRVLEFDQVRFGPYDRYHDDSPYRSSDHDPVIVGAELIEDDLIGALIGDIRTLVMTGVLNQGQGRSLTAKLENAQRQLESGRPNSRRAAANMLRAFQNELRSLVRSGTLNEAYGALLASMADAVARDLH